MLYIIVLIGALSYDMSPTINYDMAPEIKVVNTKPTIPEVSKKPKPKSKPKQSYQYRRPIFRIFRRR